MKRTMDDKLFNKSLLGLIPLVGIVIAGVYFISYGVSDASSSIKTAIQGITMTAGIWVGCMAIVIFLWKKFPWEEKPLLHLVLEITAILVYTLVFSIALYSIEIKYLDFPETPNIGMDIFTTLLITFLITSINESVFFYKQWKDNFSKSVRLEKAHLEAKYEALMAQVNPHFLFNSLNGLAGIVGENKPVVDYIENLSALLRYMMKSGEKELVLLSEELEILKCYINLHLARFDGSLQIEVDIPDSLFKNAVPPLVLQMLVENCMKHNVMSRENPLKVKIEADHDSITVMNNLHKKSVVYSTGLGLENIRGRYGFFTSRKVEVSENDGIFKVKIPLLQAEL
jgi:sensor histidine kinase YesM